MNKDTFDITEDTTRMSPQMVVGVSKIYGFVKEASLARTSTIYLKIRKVRLFGSWRKVEAVNLPDAADVDFVPNSGCNPTRLCDALRIIVNLLQIFCSSTK
ncbi:hypothetical protein CEXT_744961 [Caerostris extrusa]|uniref:Uncharacterized protein n=1 Tax=Caerostris extrusa TaxID=172846 RepID=A0AAV4UHZ6_CAEEX|nr:hypothetical protein CEXT_744961 [Caerostris extrusa]